MADKKHEMSGFDVLCLEQEFQQLVGGNFDKCYQPSREEVLLKLRAPEQGRFDVAIGLGRYITHTTRSRDNPKHPPEFSKQMRTFLSGGKILDVEQHEFDRILEFTIGKHDGEYRIVVESFAKGNVILVKDGEIELPLIHTEWGDREIRPNAEWKYPPSEINPRTATEPQYIEVLRSSDSDMVRTLSSLGNLGPVYAEEVLERAGIAKEATPDELDSAELADVTRTVKDMIAQVVEDPNPVLVRDEDGEPVDATPLPLEIHDHLDHEPVDTLSKAHDELFGPHVEEGIDDSRLDEVDEMRQRLERQIDDIGSRLENFQEQEEQSQAHGDLLYANFQDVEAALEQAQSLHEEQGWGGVFENEIEHGSVRMTDRHPETGEITLAMPDSEGHLHEIRVDITEGVGDNATRLYEKAKELREKQKGARKALAETKQRLEEVNERGEEIVEELEAKRSKPDPTNRFWFEKFRWCYSSTGSLLLGGSDAKSNEKVVKKHLEDSDRYVHSSMPGAPSVVVKAEDGEVPDEAVTEAAQFAVAYSGAWSDKLGRGEAYWVTPPQVSKTPESGEYLPTGSFIIRGDRNHIRAPMQAAVGATQIQGHFKIMGGPVAAIEAHCDRYLVLEPGRTDPGDLASILSELFDVPVEEIQRVLPPGSVRLVRSNGINEKALSEVDQ
jgi:predicted ribosome quality control (RQC) complex YloA/Tae2 family protein